MFNREQITSFDEISLRLSGMRITEEYKVLCREDEAEISQYWLSYENHEDNYNLQKRVKIPASEFIELLNRCRVLKWDNFYGKNPRGILDGTMFLFTATVNDGRKLRAEGSNNYPKHFRDFTDALYDFLNSREESS